MKNIGLNGREMEVKFIPEVRIRMRFSGNIFCICNLCLFAESKERKELNQKTSRKNIGDKMTEHLTKQDFLDKVFNYEENEEWSYEGDVPAIIDFWADWCAPCKAVAPVLEELSEEYAGQLNVYKVNTEQEQELASVFGIRSIPSLLFIPTDGQPQMATGALPKDAFVQAIENVFGIKPVAQAAN